MTGAREGRVGRTYPLNLTDPQLAFYQVEAREGGGFGWVWCAEGEEEDTSVDTYTTPVEALLAAAQDAEDCISDQEGGAKLARRIRASARALAKSAAAVPEAQRPDSSKVDTATALQAALERIEVLDPAEHRLSRFVWELGEADACSRNLHVSLCVCGWKSKPRVYRTGAEKEHAHHQVDMRFA